MIVSSWLDTPTQQLMMQQYSASTLRWQSKLMESTSNERVYEHTLVSRPPSSVEEYGENYNSAVTECCVIVELDTRREEGNSSHEVELIEDCPDTHLHTPPCISFHTISDEFISTSISRAICYFFYLLRCQGIIRRITFCACELHLKREAVVCDIMYLMNAKAFVHICLDSTCSDLLPIFFT